jgi:predicted lipid-binding transport protein (Tim44 family)
MTAVIVDLRGYALWWETHGARQQQQALQAQQQQQPQGGARVGVESAGDKRTADAAALPAAGDGVGEADPAQLSHLSKLPKRSDEA